MPKTALEFASAPPRADRFEVLDDAVRGLRMVVQPSGHRSWAVRYRQAGALRKYTIGDFAKVPLKDARKIAADVLVKVAAAADPQAEKTAKRRTGLDRESQLGEVYESRYLPHCEANLRPKSVSNIRSAFKLVLLPRFARRPLRTITPAEVLAAVEGAGDPQHAFAVGRAFFGWAASKLLVDRNPFDNLKAPAAGAVFRDRVLTADEIRKLWKAADAMAYPFGPALKLLLLTGARLREVTEMTAGEVDLEKREWTLPAARTKNKREHVIHLSDAAVEIFKTLPNIKSKNGYRFTTTGDSPVSGYSKAKVIVDRLMKGDGEAIPDWTFHDLRRTAATGMGELGVAIHVIEAALNHVSGSRGGLVGRYQHQAYAAERRDAFQKWGEHVTALVSPIPARHASPQLT